MNSREQFTDHSVNSKDDTLITYKQLGNGEGIIILPGALSVADDFDKLSRELAKSFTVFTVNRRGRAGSGEQGADYSIQKEIEDVDAVQRATGAQYIFGHSFGGFVALEYARNRTGIGSVMVYEPGISVDGSIPMHWDETSRHYLAKDKRLDAFIEFVRAMNPESAKAPRWVLKAMLPIFMKKSELHRKYELLFDTIAEHAEEARLDNTYRNYHEIKANVLLMRGGKENVVMPAYHAMVKEFPSWKEKTFQRFDHFGPENHPEQIAKTIKGFVVSK